MFQQTILQVFFHLQNDDKYSRVSALYPESPTNLHVANGTDGLRLCWSGDKNNDLISYSVHIKDVPKMMLQGDVS